MRLVEHRSTFHIYSELRRAYKNVLICAVEHTILYAWLAWKAGRLEGSISPRQKENCQPHVVWVLVHSKAGETINCGLYIKAATLSTFYSCQPKSLKWDWLL